VAHYLLSTDYQGLDFLSRKTNSLKEFIIYGMEKPKIANPSPMERIFIQFLLSWIAKK